MPGKSRASVHEHQVRARGLWALSDARFWHCRPSSEFQGIVLSSLSWTFHRTGVLLSASGWGKDGRGLLAVEAPNIQSTGMGLGASTEGHSPPECFFHTGPTVCNSFQSPTPRWVVLLPALLLGAGGGALQVTPSFFSGTFLKIITS